MRAIILGIVLAYVSCYLVNIGRMQQKWAYCEFFQSESSPDPMKLNPIHSWSAKFLKIISPIHSWSVNVKSFIFLLPHEAKELLELFCLQPNTTGWKQNSPSSAFRINFQLLENKRKWQSDSRRRQWLTTSLTGPSRTKLLTALLPGNPIILTTTKSGSMYEI